MAIITGLTAARMLDIEAGSIVDGQVIGDNLILTTRGGATIDAGDVRGPIGPTGAAGADGEAMSYVTDEDATVYAPNLAGADITYPNASVVLTEGTYFLMAQAAVQSNQVDAVAIALLDASSVKKVQGVTCTASTTASAVGCTASGIVVVASTMTLKIQAQRNGGSTVLTIGNATAMNPAQRITALRFA